MQKLPKITKILSVLTFSSLVLSSFVSLSIKAQTTQKTYHVSTSGLDSNNGTSQATAFKSVSKVNSLNLVAGDSVLFKCGDTWQGESLDISKSGTTANKITFGSFPTANCANKPVLSGSKSITGWTATSSRPGVFEANLSSGSNMGNFPNGINGIFKNNERLQFGRTPNINAASGGYTPITAQNSGNQVTIAGLPNKNWTGASVHIMGMRWYILNRTITGNNGNTLNLNANAGCWGGNCAAGGGWGAWVDNSIETLDQEGEWYFDKATNKAYIFSSSTPANIEGSVILKTDNRAWGGINLGKDFDRNGISNVIVHNFEVKNWYRHGISTPTNLAETENNNLIIKNNTIGNIEEKGINLGTWVFDAKDGRQSNWRGGYNQTFENNLIDGANHFGIDTYSRNSQFIGNTIKNIGLIKNLTNSGMGCGFEGGNCTENGNGIMIRTSNVADTGRENLIKFNNIQKTGYNGIDVFGQNNTLEKNYIDEPCYSKGDCGGVRNFGGASAKNTIIKDNIITNSVGNTDGANTTFKELFGFGLYIDYDSDNAVVTGNTVIGSSNSGLIFIDSPNGKIENNTVYGNAKGTTGREEISINSNKTTTTFTGNVAYSIKPETVALHIDNKDRITSSNNNYFFNPYGINEFAVNGNSSFKTLAPLKTHPGKDGNSKT